VAPRHNRLTVRLEEGFFMARHIGIVGCSAEGASLCYRTICAEGAALFGPHAHPEVSMHTHSLADYVACLDAGDLQGVATLMLSSAGKLAKAGADFLVCPDNTIHQAMPMVLPHSPLPWLHIAEVVADEAASRGLRRVGVLGTRWLVDSEVYPQALSARGIEAVRPDVADRSEIGRLIMEELVRGVFQPASVAVFQAVIDRLKDRECDAVVLGCTEIPLIIDDTNSSLPTLDSTRLLARAALRFATRGEARPPAPPPLPALPLGLEIQVSSIGSVAEDIRLGPRLVLRRAIARVADRVELDLVFLERHLVVTAHPVEPYIGRRHLPVLVVPQRVRMNFRHSAGKRHLLPWMLVAPAEFVVNDVAGRVFDGERAAVVRTVRATRPHVLRHGLDGRHAECGEQRRSDTESR